MVRINSVYGDGLEAGQLDMGEARNSINGIVVTCAAMTALILPLDACAYRDSQDVGLRGEHVKKAA